MCCVQGDVKVKQEEGVEGSPAHRPAASPLPLDKEKDAAQAAVSNEPAYIYFGFVLFVFCVYVILICLIVDMLHCRYVPGIGTVHPILALVLHALTSSLPQWALGFLTFTLPEFFYDVIMPHAIQINDVILWGLKQLHW